MASRRTERKLGKEFRKIQPKLRMIAKAYDNVNAIRADFASAIRVRPSRVKALSPEEDIPRLSGIVPSKKLKTPKLKTTSDSIEVNVFLSKYSSITESRATDSRLGVTCQTDDGNMAPGVVLRESSAPVTH